MHIELILQILVMIRAEITCVPRKIATIGSIVGRQHYIYLT